MAGAKGIKAGRAYVELGAEDKKLLAGLKKATNRLRSFGQSVGAIGSQMARVGTIALAPLLGAAKVFSSLGDTIAKMARRTGLSVEALSEMRFVASQTGTSLAGFELAVKRMQRTIYDAGRGLSTAVDGLSDLGLAVADLDSLAPEEQFKLLADRIATIEDPTTKAAIAMTLFGRSGADLLPMLEQGAAGIEALQKEARRLGLTMSSKDAKAAEHFTDKLDKMTKVAKQAVFELGAALAPALEKAFESLVKTIQGARDWIREHEGMIRRVLKLTATVVGLGVALAVLGKIVTITAAALKGALWLAAHPVVILIAAIGAAALATAAALGAFSSKVSEAAEEMEKLRRANDAVRAKDVAALARLEALASQQSLNNAEVFEATGLIYDLEKRYGALGLTLDKLTSKLEVAGDAQRRLRDAMRAGEIEDLNKAIDEMTARHRVAVESIAATEEALARSRREAETQAGRVSPSITGGVAAADVELYTKRLAALRAEAAATSDELTALWQRRADLTAEAAEKHVTVGARPGAEERRVLDANLERRWTLAQLELRLRYKGLTLERALLDLAWKKARIEAEARKENLQLLDEEYRKRLELLEQTKDVSSAVEMRVIGTFNPAAIRGLESSNLGRRTATATERTATNTRDMLDIMRGGALAFM